MLSSANTSASRWEHRQVRSLRNCMRARRKCTCPWCRLARHLAHPFMGHRRDRSTAVVGGLSPFEPRLTGIKEAEELPQGLYGSARASALAIVDRRYDSNAIIVADLSSDPT